MVEGHAGRQAVQAGLADLAHAPQVHHAAQAERAERADVLGGDMVQAIAAQCHPAPENPPVSRPVAAQIAGIQRTPQTETAPDQRRSVRLR
nr:hypothetical protein KitaXyl93_35620 [Kitasatospora sp. Xyl93]